MGLRVEIVLLYLIQLLSFCLFLNKFVNTLLGRY